MSAMAGLVPQVKTVVTNAVSLHTVVPSLSRTKLNVAVPLMNTVTEYLNPQWGLKQPTLAAKLTNLLVKLTHHECDNAVCKQVSFTYGSGFPALWLHENLNEETHEWVKQEFANVPLTFFKQMAQCVRKGHLVSVEGQRDLPADFTAQPPQTDARFAFFAGRKNLCFLPESQERSFDYFNGLRKNYHSLRVFPTYSHLDVFLGRKAVHDTYPEMLAELERKV